MVLEIGGDGPVGDILNTFLWRSAFTGALEPAFWRSHACNYFQEWCHVSTDVAAVSSLPLPQGARIWCDGKEYAADPATGAVLLPYVRTTRTTSLVLAAPAPSPGSGASAGPISGSVDEIVTFIPQYKRLAEFYKLAASISCPHEALLPRTTAQLQVGCKPSCCMCVSTRVCSISDSEHTTIC
jgi:hypothetical protein